MSVVLGTGDAITISSTAKGSASLVALSKYLAVNAITGYFGNTAILLNNNAVEAATLSVEQVVLAAAKNNTNELKIAAYYDSPRPFKESALYYSEFPGYQNAYFEFINIITGKTTVVGFMVSPNSVSFSYSTAQQTMKTMAGWHLLRSGKNIQQINLTGYMLDTKHCQERHNFIETYKAYVEDKKNANNEYANDYAVNLIIEGRKYIGIMQSLGLQKSSVQPFLYQYNISYLSLNDFLIFQSSESVKNKRTSAVPKVAAVEDSVGSSMMVGTAAGSILGIS